METVATLAPVKSAQASSEIHWEIVHTMMPAANAAIIATTLPPSRSHQLIYAPPAESTG